MFFALLLAASSAWATDFSLIQIPPAETTGYPGSPLLLSVTGRSESGTEIKYQWKKDGNLLKSETQNVLIVKKPQAKDAGLYSVDVTSGEETKSAQSRVTISKTKLKLPPRAPASVAAPAGPSCHESAAPQAKKADDKGSHHHHGH